MPSSVGFVVKHNIIFSGVLSSNEFTLGVRLSEEYEYDSMTIWELSGLLFVEIESGWWCWMCLLEEICVVILVLML